MSEQKEIMSKQRRKNGKSHRGTFAEFGIFIILYCHQVTQRNSETIVINLL